jgi:hypothetical protein
MKNGVFSDVTPCSFCKNQCLGGMYQLHHQGEKNQQARNTSVLRLLVTASLVPGSPILVTLMKEAPSSSETPVITRATQRNIPEDTVLRRFSSWVIERGASNLSR